ncbi:hypothetical protein BESB_013640 [Besnoitia besnoiti]|uniref:Uncharacterized protein n=1 Tax=Besnoitia besnoiti TaxID=94643 RepID=A0A2A9MBI7_BESBE|nr:hypothetical protein BESB_013640 [Besnoitia besnoiti]PFH32752.1 hypothetical protein BESB_013640 [Besnoitia besnoiti]
MTPAWSAETESLGFSHTLTVPSRTVGHKPGTEVYSVVSSDDQPTAILCLQHEGNRPQAPDGENGHNAYRTEIYAERESPVSFRCEAEGCPSGECTDSIKAADWEDADSSSTIGEGTVEHSMRHKQADPETLHSAGALEYSVPTTPLGDFASGTHRQQFSFLTEEGLTAAGGCESEGAGRFEGRLSGHHSPASCTQRPRSSSLPSEESAGAVREGVRQLEEAALTDAARLLSEEDSEASDDINSSKNPLSLSEADQTSASPKEVMGLGDMIAAGRQRRQAVEALSMMGFQMPPGGLASMNPQQQQMMAMFLMQQQQQMLAQRQGLGGQEAPLGPQQLMQQQMLWPQQQQMIRGQPQGRGGGRNRSNQGNSGMGGTAQRANRLQRQNEQNAGFYPAQTPAVPTMPSPAYSPSAGTTMFASHYQSPYLPGGKAGLPGVGPGYPAPAGLSAGTNYGYGAGVTGMQQNAGTLMAGYGGSPAAPGLAFSYDSAAGATGTPQSPYDANLQPRQQNVDEAARWAEQLRRQQAAWARQNA